MFDENSAMVALYLRKIREGFIIVEDVPNLSNLKEVIKSILN